jgi:hypothetical protein
MRKIQNSQSSFDRLIDGKAPSADSPADSLSLFVEQAKRVAAIAPSPAAEQAHLKTILEQAQLLVDKGEPAARPASKATGPEIQASGLPTRRRKVVLSSLFGSLTTKLAAAGVAVMMTGTGALAATGSLPDTVQDKFAVAAEVVGIDLPDSGEVTVTDTGTTDDDTDGTETDGTEDTEGTNGKSSSDDVHAAQDATEPGPERGKAVSEAARQKPAGVADPEVDESDAAETGNETSSAVHEAIDSTEPGPERGKAVSEAASGKSRGGDSDETEDETETTAGAKNKK